MSEVVRNHNFHFNMAARFPGLTDNFSKLPSIRGIEWDGDRGYSIPRLICVVAENEHCLHINNFKQIYFD